MQERRWHTWVHPETPRSGISSVPGLIRTAMSDERSGTSKSKRQERLEAALRENLKKRKDQARARRLAEPAPALDRTTGPTPSEEPGSPRERTAGSDGSS